jgi:hypothetical protein
LHTLKCENAKLFQLLLAHGVDPNVADSDRAGKELLEDASVCLCCELFGIAWSLVLSEHEELFQRAGMYK